MQIVSHRLARFQAIGAATAIVAGLAVATAGLDTAQAADGGASEIKTEISETLDAIKAYSAEKRDDAVAAGGALMDKLDRQMAKMEYDIEQASEETSDAAKAKWQETKAGLMKLRESTAMKLEAMREGTAETWSQTKKEFSDSVETLGKSIEEAGEDLQS